MALRYYMGRATLSTQITQTEPQAIALPARNFLDENVQPEVKQEEVKPALKQEDNRSREAQHWWDKFRDNFQNKSPAFQAFRSHFTSSLNVVGIVLNSLAVLATNMKIFPKNIANFLDKKSEWFARYIIPFAFGWNGIEALVGNRFLESVLRMVPAVSFWSLPFYNFNIATGISSAFAYLFEHVKSRHGGQYPGTTMIENMKVTINTSIDIFSDMFKDFSLRLKEGSWRDIGPESFQKQVGTIALFLGSFGAMLFANQERDSWLARLFGGLRNLGGLVADWELIFNDDPDKENSKTKRIVGTSCITASILNIFKRWLDPKLGRAFDHIAIALDDFGLTYWSHSSKKDNDRAKRNKETKRNQEAKMIAPEPSSLKPIASPKVLAL